MKLDGWNPGDVPPEQLRRDVKGTALGVFLFAVFFPVGMLLFAVLFYTLGVEDSPTGPPIVGALTTVGGIATGAVALRVQRRR